MKKTPTIMPLQFEGDEYMMWLPPEPMHQLFIYDRKIDHLPIGWIQILSEDKLDAFILFMQVRNKYRRQGYMTKLIKMIQHAYDRIETDFDMSILDEPGTKLLMKNGFTIQNSLHKRMPGKLIWRKKNDGKAT